MHLCIQSTDLQYQLHLMLGATNCVHGGGHKEEQGQVEALESRIGTNKDT